MTSDVATIGPDQLVADAAQMLEDRSVRRLPVLDEEGQLIGIVTDSDIREAETAGSVLSSYEPDLDPRWLTVADIMTSEVVTIGPNATVGELVTVLIENKVGGVPVVEADPHFPKQHRLIGIVSETDIFTMIADAWAAETNNAS
jgi:acetoin utilization protein AcuB